MIVAGCSFFPLSFDNQILNDQRFDLFSFDNKIIAIVSECGRFAINDQINFSLRVNSADISSIELDEGCFTLVELNFSFSFEEWFPSFAQMQPFSIASRNCTADVQNICWIKKNVLFRTIFLLESTSLMARLKFLSL